MSVPCCGSRAQPVAQEQQYAFKGCEFALAQPPEGLADQQPLRRNGFFGGGSPEGSEKDGMRPSIAFRCPSLDEPSRHQTIDEAGNIAFGHIEAFGELLLAYALLFP
jgi:hypothetical protein